MFGISFTELVLILVVALVVLGPERLPGMLRTIGLWIHKIRRMTTEVRAQTGIDDLLRQEGIAGGLSELRALMRGDPQALLRPNKVVEATPVEDPYGVVSEVEIDASRERPVEGPDSYGALADDLVDEEALNPAVAAQPLEGQVESGSSSSMDATTDPNQKHEGDSPEAAISPANIAPGDAAGTDLVVSAPSDAARSSNSATSGEPHE